MRAMAMAGIFLALILSASQVDAQPVPSHYHCYMRVDGDAGKPGMVYTSQIIASDKAATTISQSWQKYIFATYPEHTAHASGTCRDFGANPAQQQQAVSSQEKSWAASNLTLIHVTYDPDQALPAAPQASPAPAGSTGLYLFCASDPSGPVVYVSAIFPATPDPGGQRGVSFTSAQNAYVAFLKQKYAFNSASNYPVSCRSSGNPTQGISDAVAMKNAQDNKQKAEDQARQQSKQVIDTGWTYSPSQAAASPAPAPAGRTHH